MRAFITGITGFAGGFLAEHLMSCGDDVSGCSRRGEWPHWAGGELRTVTPAAWDVGKNVSDEVRSAVAAFSPDCIFHLAALSVPSDCGGTEPTGRAIEVNVRGTEGVLDLAASLPRPPRVVFVSTSHVYGKGTKDRHLFDEQTPPNPQRAYGKTKLMAEEAVHRAVVERGLDAVIARAFQHTGPRQEPRLMLPEWAQQAARPVNDQIQIKHPDTWVDLTDARDVVRAYRLLAQRGASGETYNVGSGVARLARDIAGILAKLAGPSKKLVQPQPAPPEKFDPIADIGRLQAATGWQPEIALETTIRDTLDYWRR